MNPLREVAQQALEALEALDAPPSGVVDHYELDRRKQALRAALEQEEQATCKESLQVEFKGGGQIATPLQLTANDLAWLETRRLVRVWKELGQMRWVGADDGWDRAIEAVRARLDKECQDVLAWKEKVEASEQALEQEEPIRPTVQEMQNAAANLKLMEEMFGGSTALAQQEQEAKGCDHCNYPLYAAIKCRVCGRVTKQEPAAWQWLNTAHFRKNLPVNAELGAWNPLYTHPPRRKWRGLTEEELLPLLHSCDWRRMHLAVLCRAIEAALKEKNNG